ncbi:MAG TPA: aminotransferase class IV [Spirochaetota bacterium]|nr:aminotransferase class IV [Spirochaetota bacterium]HOM10732.1 aminotransferase class IV [Spirochaetota bacterium]HPP51075.1 aminotransferase class IV [Spirochaetota bacterium]
MVAWLNGSLTDIHNAKVSLLSHSFSRGTAIFEVLEIVTNGKGTALLGLHQHCERFFNSARALHIQLPYNKEQIIEAIVTCAKANNCKNGLVKFFAYFDDIELTIVPHSMNVSLAIFCINYETLNFDVHELSKPSRACLSTYKKIDPLTVPVYAKVAGNYVNSYLAQMEAKQKGYSDAILVDTQGNIAEAATANIFFVKGQSLYTPTLRSIMPGITRMIVLDIAHHDNIPATECDIPAESINQFSEAFFSGSVNNIQPIESIDDIIFRPVPGTISQIIQDKVTSLISGNHPLTNKYLYYF